MFPIVAPVLVEEVGKGVPGRQFADLAMALGGRGPGVEWLLAGQRRRLMGAEPPLGEAARLLARRDGRPVARLSAHQQGDGSGSFGFLAVESAADVDAVRALLGAASAWLADRGSTTILGPLSWTAADEAGVLVDGEEAGPTTGRAWNQCWYGAVLEAAGLMVAEELCSFRLAAAREGAGAAVLSPSAFAVPPDVGRFADPALQLAWPEGEGSVVAVPDLAGAAAGTGGAWSLARRARRRDWEGCVVTAMDGDGSVLIPGLCAAAARAGYEWVLSPWAPDGRRPLMRHHLYRGDIASLVDGATVVGREVLGHGPAGPCCQGP